MSLSDVILRTVKAGAKDSKMADGRGLYLLVKATGGRLWRFDYRHEEKRKTLALGVYPDISLKDARDRCEAARKLLAQGVVNPADVRKAQKAAIEARTEHAFEVVARRWHATRRGQWSEKYAAKVLSSFERDVFPWLGGQGVADIEPPEVLATCRRITDRGAIETAHTVKSYISGVMRFAVGEGLIKSDPCRDLRGLLPAVPKTKHFASISDPVKVGELLRAMDAFTGSNIVCSALHLAPLVFTRIGEL
jgi:hypothetical protein